MLGFLMDLPFLRQPRHLFLEGKYDDKAHPCKGNTFVRFLLRIWTTFFSAIFGLSLLVVTLSHSLDVIHQHSGLQPYPVLYIFQP